MPAAITISDFLEVVRRSGLLDPAALDAAFTRWRIAGEPAEEPAKLAAFLIHDGLITHFQAEQLLRGRHKGFTLGKYKVLERLGVGGMGAVYLGEHEDLRRRVAIKVLPVNQSKDAAVQERFRREAQAGAILNHPNIVHVYDFDRDGQTHFLVMEYVDGASLEKIVRQHGPLAIARAAHYIRQTALGLQHAHEFGIVHRDVKPGNLLLDRHGQVKILDLGLARFRNEADTPLARIEEQFVMGTADYIAPELALNEDEIDIRADIYSLGATFYFLLLGWPPFYDGNVTQKLIWHQMRPVPPIPQFRPEVPPELSALVERMLAKDPEERYATPGAVAAALDPWTAAPVTPPPENEMPVLCPALQRVLPAAPQVKKGWTFVIPNPSDKKARP